MSETKSEAMGRGDGREVPSEYSGVLERDGLKLGGHGLERLLSCQESWSNTAATMAS